MSVGPQKLSGLAKLQLGRLNYTYSFCTASPNSSRHMIALIGNPMRLGRTISSQVAWRRSYASHRCRSTLVVGGGASGASEAACARTCWSAGHRAETYERMKSLLWCCLLSSILPHLWATSNAAS